MAVGIASCCSTNAGMVCGACLYLFLSVYSLFSLAWTIVGVIMFWSKMNPTGLCEGGVQIYMYIILIMGLISICCNICLGVINKNSSPA